VIYRLVTVKYANIFKLLQTLLWLRIS